MDFTYDELYEIKYLLKYSLRDDKDLIDKDRKTQETAFKKVIVKLNLMNIEKDLLKIEDSFELGEKIRSLKDNKK